MILPSSCSHLNVVSTIEGFVLALFLLLCGFFLSSGFIFLISFMLVLLSIIIRTLMSIMCTAVASWSTSGE